MGAIDKSVLNLNANKTEYQRYILNYLPENNQWNYTLGAVYRHYRETNYDTWVLSRNMLNNTQIKYAGNSVSEANKLLDYSSFESENKFRYENNAKTASGFKLISGASLEYARYHNQTFRKNFGKTENYNSNMDLFKWALFEQVSKEVFNKKLTLSLGARLDGNNYNAFMNNMLNQISPRFSASYSITQQLFWNFNIGRYFELPPYTALGYRDTLGVLVNKSNNIQYISANHYVTGVDYLPNSNSKLSVEGFFKYYQHYPFSITDSIALANKGADFGTYGDEPLISTGVGRAYGLEVLYQNKDLMGTNITLSYTLVRSEFQDMKGKYIASAWDSKHLLNLLVRKEFKNNWTLGMKWRFVGGLPYTPIDLEKSEIKTAWNIKNQAYYNYSRFNSERLKPFHQLDVRVDKDFYFNKWMLVLYTDIQNIYNFKADQPPTYVVDYSVPVSGTPEKYTLKKLGGTGGGTILPTVGIIVQF